MILPTKRLEENRSLVFIGGIILQSLHEPMTVSKLWKSVKQSQAGTALSYDWFVLALDFLFLAGGISYAKGLLKKSND